MSVPNSRAQSTGMSDKLGVRSWKETVEINWVFEQLKGKSHAAWVKVSAMNDFIREEC